MNHQRLREMVEELCDVQSGLTNWECDFVSNMLDWEGGYTEKQEATITKIYERVIK